MAIVRSRDEDLHVVFQTGRHHRHAHLRTRSTSFSNGTGLSRFSQCLDIIAHLSPTFVRIHVHLRFIVELESIENVGRALFTTEKIHRMYIHHSVLVKVHRTLGTALLPDARQQSSTEIGLHRHANESELDTAGDTIPGHTQSATTRTQELQIESLSK